MFNQLLRRFDDSMTVDWRQRGLQYSPSWSSNFPSAWLRSRLCVEDFSLGVHGSLAYPSSPGRANASHISLQNLANRLHKKQKVGSAGRVTLFSGTTSLHINGALLTSYSPIEFFNPVIPRVIFGTPPPAHTFNPETLPDFAVKSRIANPELRIREIPYPGKPIVDPRHLSCKQGKREKGGGSESIRMKQNIYTIIFQSMNG